ncbi:MAG: hypothetical protein ACJAT7_003419 [Psychromonas sp.]|jgi:hypothetical protein
MILGKNPKMNLARVNRIGLRWDSQTFYKIRIDVIISTDR